MRHKGIFQLHNKGYSFTKEGDVKVCRSFGTQLTHLGMEKKEEEKSKQAGNLSN